MNRLAFCTLILIVGVAQQAVASGIVRIANGDCAALSKAAAATPGQEPALIVLATNGSYTCAAAISVTGNITIDGAGATLPMLSGVTESGSETPATIAVASGASLTVRNINLGNSAPNATAGVTPTAQPKFCCAILGPAISNSGNLTLDSVSIFGNQFSGGPEVVAIGFFHNSGNLILRNVSIVGNFYSGNDPALLTNSGSVDISQSSFVSTASGYAQALLDSTSPGTMNIRNSIIVNNGSYAAPDCAADIGQIMSLGGNIVSDTTCGLNGPDDHVLANAGLADFGNHGGLVQTLALNNNSPAIGNGLAANCEATDARGLTRGQNGCDSGAYELGGGPGQLTQSGMSGLYFNAASNGHFVSVQSLDANTALVIWNTFNQEGAPAWVYGVGTVSGNDIHVAQVAQNVGGVLHAGGNVTGATASLWGSFDLTVPDCLSATLNYQSALPLFGSGTINLQRLVFVNGVDCSQ